MGAVACFSTKDVLIKSFSDTYALHQIVLIRSVIALAIVLLVVLWSPEGLRLLATRRLGSHIVRAFFVVAANMTFFLALAALPLADAVAVFFISPLVITVFSVVFLGESVGPRRWTAILVGFVGVLVIVRPGTQAFQIAALLPMLAAVCYAALNTMTRTLGQTEPTARLVFYIQVVFVFVALGFGLVAGDGRFEVTDEPSLSFLLRAWRWPEPADALPLAAIGLVVTGGAWLISRAYSVAEAGLVAPFEYIALPLAVLWGIVLFGEWPDIWTWCGITLILGSGMYLVWRERIATRQ